MEGNGTAATADGDRPAGRPDRPLVRPRWPSKSSKGMEGRTSGVGARRPKGGPRADGTFPPLLQSVCQRASRLRMCVWPTAGALARACRGAAAAAVRPPSREPGAPSVARLCLGGGGAAAQTADLKWGPGLGTIVIFYCIVTQ